MSGKVAHRPISRQRRRVSISHGGAIPDWRCRDQRLVAPMMYRKAGNRFVVLYPIGQVASVAVIRLILKLGRLDHVHGSPSVHQPFAGGF